MLAFPGWFVRAARFRANQPIATEPTTRRAMSHASVETDSANDGPLNLAKYEEELQDILRPEEKALIIADIDRIMKNSASNIWMLTSNNPNFSDEDRMKTINANRTGVLTKPLELPPPKKLKKDESNEEADPKPKSIERESAPPVLTRQLTTVPTD